MSAGEVRVEITLDATAFTAAMRRAANGVRNFAAHFRQVTRAAYRLGLTPGERHIDRVCREIVAGKPGRDAAVRLLAAADLAALLDRRAVR